MNYRSFGNTDLLVSEVGFGAWAIGGAAHVGQTAIGWGNTNNNESIAAIHAALDAGINFFDTADFYGLGLSEELIGKATKGNTAALIATKVGHRNIDDKIVLDYSKAYVIEACEASLKRLKKDSIDYYQLHSARLDQLQNGECIEAMEQLKQAGKIRYWGLSLNTFEPLPEAEFLINNKYGNGFQLVLNLINQRAVSLLSLAATNGYGIIARMPLQFGLLTGKFSAASTFETGDHRGFRLTPEIIEKTVQLLHNNVWPEAARQHMNATQIALSFILSFPEVSTVIPGIRLKEQVALNTEGLQALSEQTKLYLQALASEWEPIVQLMQARG